MVGDGWRKSVSRQERLRDGLVATTEGRKVRVRLYERRATLTVKANHRGAVRAEFEYDIPRPDAEELLTQHCGQNILEKIRHIVEFGGFTWEVDEYAGILSGVILAEVELDRADIELPRPGWLGAEVTGVPEYSKINMLKARQTKLSTG